MNVNYSSQYKSGAVRALVALHEREMRKFMAVWQRAAEIDLTLPPTEDPSCKTIDTMLHHVLRASRGYVLWICDNLNLDKPDIISPSKTMDFKTEALSYLESLLDVWSTALIYVTDDQCYIEFKSRWNTIYCIDGMLEHAVMHPSRHSFQLVRIMSDL